MGHPVMRKLISAGAASILLLWASNALALMGDEILGFWNDREHSAVIEIYKCGKNYCGKIASAAKGPKTDINNPDPGLRGRPIIGMELMKGFSFDGRQWKGGKLYDPTTGNTYSGKIRLGSPDTLKLRGYAIISLFGKTATWKRAGQKKH